MSDFEPFWLFEIDTDEVDADPDSLSVTEDDGTVKLYSERDRQKEEDTYHEGWVFRQEETVKDP